MFHTHRHQVELAVKEGEVTRDGLQLVASVGALRALVGIRDHLPELVHEVPRDVITAVLLMQSLKNYNKICDNN